MRDSLIVLVEDSTSADVIQAVDLGVTQVFEFLRMLESWRFEHGQLLRASAPLLEKFGVVESPFAEINAWNIVLLCYYLTLTVVAFSGSCCSDLGKKILGIGVEKVEFPDFSSSLCMKRRELACLQKFVGGPVWVFGRNNLDKKAQISISIEQFDTLWGPLWAVPASRGFEELLAIQTDGGILIAAERDERGELGTPTAKGEIKMHWIEASIRTRQSTRDFASDNFVFARYKTEERLPHKMYPFSSKKRLLIGSPTVTTTTSVVVAGNSKANSSIRLTLGSEPRPDFYCNESCESALADFRSMNNFRFQVVGVREAFRIPDEYQVNFSAGQYMTFGVQKSWKKRPAINHKTMLLEYLSKPTATPEAVRQLLNLFVGLELSACTGNAQRITLEEALKLAFPDHLEAIETAQRTREIGLISRLVTDLEATGIGHDGKLLLFWPLSNGFNEVYKSPRVPRWSRILKDSPYTSCFAVLSPRCLTFSGQDCGAPIKRLCSKQMMTKKCTPILQTTIELNPEASIRPPLNINTKLKLVQGKISIRNEEVRAQLAYFSTYPWPWGPGWGDTITHRELIGGNHMSPSRVSVCLCDHPSRLIHV